MGKKITNLNLVVLQEATGHSPTLWMLDEPFIYQTTLAGTLTVPIGFLTDLASVPRLPLAWLLAGGLGNAAATIHDYLYTTRKVPRKIADKVFYEILQDDKIDSWRAWLMYRAVRLFGFLSY